MPREVLEGVYIVEKIVGKRKVHGEVQYEVKWKGYSSQENTWEPLENLQNVMDMVEQFDTGKKVIKSKPSSVQKVQVQQNNPAAPKSPKQIKKIKRERKLPKEEPERRAKSPQKKETPQKPIARELERAQRLDESRMSKLRIRKILTILSRGGVGEAMYEVDFQIDNGIQPLPTVLSEGEISSLDPAKLIDFFRDLYEQVNN